MAEQLFGDSAVEVIGKSGLPLIRADRLPKEREILSKADRGERVLQGSRIRVGDNGIGIDARYPGRRRCFGIRLARGDAA